jgi:hypothetical protein
MRVRSRGDATVDEGQCGRRGGWPGWPTGWELTSRPHIRPHTAAPRTPTGTSDARAWCWPNARSTGEVGGFQPLLAHLELSGAVVTVDALHTSVSAPTGWSPSSRRLPAVVKTNQPTLLERCAGLAWHHVPCLTVRATGPTAGWRSVPS